MCTLFVTVGNSSAAGVSWRQRQTDRRNRVHPEIALACEGNGLAHGPLQDGVSAAMLEAMSSVLTVEPALSSSRRAAGILQVPHGRMKSQ